MLAQNHPARTTSADCPPWCTDHNEGVHRTAASLLPTLSGEALVRVFRFGAEDSDERVQIGSQVFTLGQASDVARHVLRHLNRVQSPAVASALDRGDVSAAAEVLLVQLADAAEEVQACSTAR